MTTSVHPPIGAVRDAVARALAEDPLTVSRFRPAPGN